MADNVWKSFSDDDLIQYNAAFRRVLDFCNSAPFRSVVSELMGIPEDLRHDFVEIVMLSNDQLAKRGISVPSYLKIQRTQFYDERPTLFCVTHEVDVGPWKKLTVTFDNSGGAFQPILKEAVQADPNTIPLLD